MFGTRPSPTDINKLQTFRSRSTHGHRQMTKAFFHNVAYDVNTLTSRLPVLGRSSLGTSPQPESLGNVRAKALDPSTIPCERHDSLKKQRLKKLRKNALLPTGQGWEKRADYANVKNICVTFRINDTRRFFVGATTAERNETPTPRNCERRIHGKCVFFAPDKPILRGRRLKFPPPKTVFTRFNRAVSANRENTWTNNVHCLGG